MSNKRKISRDDAPELPCSRCLLPIQEGDKVIIWRGADGEASDIKHADCTEPMVAFSGGPFDGMLSPWPLPDHVEVPAGWTGDQERSGDYEIVRGRTMTQPALAIWRGEGA